MTPQRDPLQRLFDESSNAPDASALTRMSARAADVNLARSVSGPRRSWLWWAAPVGALSVAAAVFLVAASWDASPSAHAPGGAAPLPVAPALAVRSQTPNRAPREGVTAARAARDRATLDDFEALLLESAPEEVALMADTYFDVGFGSDPSADLLIASNEAWLDYDPDLEDSP